MLKGIFKLMYANPVTKSWPWPTGEHPESEDTSVLQLNTIHAIGMGGKGGVTIVWRKLAEHRNARMVEVAVTYCSPHDTYTKKIGRDLAIKAFHAGRTVTVPARTCNSDCGIRDTLLNMFWDILQ